MKLKSIPIVYKKLGRSKVWGYGHQLPLELDSRLKGKKHIEILLHEATHYLFPNLSEEEVTEKSILLTNTLWNEGYRKTDNDTSFLLQDGTI